MPGAAPASEQRPARVANSLGAAIVAGRYAAGDRLPGEMAAARHYEVSRPAYREAIRTLASKGLIESLPKSGTRVCERARWNLLDPDVLRWLLAEDAGRTARELMELRAMVEPAAAAAAAERRKPADLAAMSAALRVMAESVPDSPAGQGADRAFHAALFAATGNEIVARLASIVAASVDFIAEYKRDRRVERDPRPDHEALYQAVAEQRPDAAREIMLRLLVHADADLHRE